MQPVDVELQRFVRAGYCSPGVVEYYTRAAVQMGLLRCEQHICARHLVESQIILDIGCGTGRTTVGLWKEGFQTVYGLDLSMPMCVAARQFALQSGADIPFAAGDARFLPFRSGTYDGVLFLFNGLMQIPGAKARAQALLDFRRVLKPNGVLVFTTPERESRHRRSRLFWRTQRDLWARGAQDRRLIEFGDVILHEGDTSLTYLHFPTISEVSKMCRLAGFEVVECQRRQSVAEESAETEAMIGGMECIVWVARTPPAGA